MPTLKQRQQQNLYRAIGTVKGFSGYLHNLQATVNLCPRLGIDKLFLKQDVNKLKNRLAILEEALRKEIKKL
jgi:hypothetical protein